MSGSYAYQDAQGNWHYTSSALGGQHHEHHDSAVQYTSDQIAYYNYYGWPAGHTPQPSQPHHSYSVGAYPYGNSYSQAPQPEYYTSPSSYSDPSNEHTREASRLAPPNVGSKKRSKSNPRNRTPSRGRTWTCDIAGCSSNAQFTRLADLQRHQSTVHNFERPRFPCTVRGCTRVGERGFTRRDHLVEHLRNFHHLDIPKRGPGERSAHPFGFPTPQ